MTPASPAINSTETCIPVLKEMHMQIENYIQAKTAEKQ